MRTSVDRAGRLVIPQALRAQVGLIDGGEVEVDVLGSAILIEPVGGQDLVMEDGFLVIPATGATVTDADVRAQRQADQR